MSAAPLNHLTVAEAARKIAAREITSEALVRACLDRVAARDGVVKAWASIDVDSALEAARAADRAEGQRGPLHGVPIGVKDIFDTFDFPTQMGSPVWAGNRSLCDASVVAIVRAAGAIVLGKTVTCEFAGIAPSVTTNPLNPAHTPGGSSSGSAAAVADFMVPAAFGTQTGGSVLRPASFCGVVGFKPTFGTFNREGLKFANESIDTIGLLTRTVEDAALLTDVLLGRAPVPLRLPPRRLRLGFCRTFMWNDKVEPATRAMIADTIAKARKAGAEVVDFGLPSDFSRINEARDIINNVERARAMAWEWAHARSGLSPQLTATIEAGLAADDADYRDALRFLESARAALDERFAAVDALITPVVNGEAPTGHSSTGDASLQGLWTALYTPSISLPAALGPNAMPIGVQLVAPRWADRALLEMALWMQREAGIAQPPRD